LSRQSYKNFDAGVAHKSVIDPHGQLGAAGDKKRTGSHH